MCGAVAVHFWHTRPLTVIETLPRKRAESPISTPLSQRSALAVVGPVDTTVTGGFTVVMSPVCECVCVCEWCECVCTAKAHGHARLTAWGAKLPLAVGVGGEAPDVLAVGVGVVGAVGVATVVVAPKPSSLAVARVVSCGQAVREGRGPRLAHAAAHGYLRRAAVVLARNIKAAIDTRWVGTCAREPPTKHRRKRIACMHALSLSLSHTHTRPHTHTHTHTHTHIHTRP